MAGRLKAKSRAQRTEEMRQAILSASTELFLEQGYEKTTTRQIIQKVGILNGSLYNIYHSKDEIFADIVLGALSEAMAMIEPCLGRDATFPERFCFVPCVQVYASARSQRIAELLAVAYNKPEIRNRCDASSESWLFDIEEGVAMREDPAFEIKVTACRGALGSVVTRLSEDAGTLDERAAMRTLTLIALSLFGMSVDDVDAYVDRVRDFLGSNDTTICGIRLRTASFS